MTSSYIYHTLFDIAVLHDYLLNDGNRRFSEMNTEEQTYRLAKYDIRKLVSFVPLTDTVRKLRNHRLIFKERSTGITVLCEVKEEDDNQPMVPVTGLHLAFQMVPFNPVFQNITSCALLDHSARIQRFSNHAGLEGATMPALSKPYQQYQQSITYEMGDLVTYGLTTYEATKNHHPSTESPDDTESGWIAIDNKAYASNADSVQATFSRFSYKAATSAPQLDFVLFGEDEAVVWSKRNVESSHDFVHALQFESVTGMVRLTVSQSGGSTIETVPLYILPDNAASNFFGIVEIYGTPDLAEYAIVNSDGSIRSPRFEIRLRNRRTVWRYRNNTTGLVTFETGPLPLTQSGLIPVHYDDTLLPNPDAHRIRPEDEYIVSETFIE